MTLKEKFETKNSIDTTNEAKAFAKECEQIAEEFAIEFAEWCTEPKNKLGYHSIKKEWFMWDLDKWVTTKELLEIFKTEKGL